MAEWIKVEEQLPEESDHGCSDYVLTWAQNPKGLFSYQLAYYCFKEQLWYFPGGGTRMNPTHWMPLSPPKDDAKCLA